MWINLSDICYRYPIHLWIVGGISQRLPHFPKKPSGHPKPHASIHMEPAYKHMIDRQILLIITEHMIHYQGYFIIYTFAFEYWSCMFTYFSLPGQPHHIPPWALCFRNQLWPWGHHHTELGVEDSMVHRLLPNWWPGGVLQIILFHIDQLISTPFVLATFIIDQYSDLNLVV